MTQYNYLRTAIYNSQQTGQINLVLAYNTRLNNTMLAELAHSFEQELLARGVNYSYTEVLEWVTARMGFDKHNHASTNATIELEKEWLNYNADGCSGGYKRAETITKFYN